MSFRTALKELAESVNGGLAAIIMGYDGIAIDEYLLDGAPFDLQLLAAEYANLFTDIKRTAELLENGKMEEVSITTDRVRALIRVISDEFFLVLVIAADGNFGKGRYLSSLAAVKFRDELG